MKTYLFDFDGTLVDSMPSFIAGVLKVLDEHSLKYNDDIIKNNNAIRVFRNGRVSYQGI